MRETALTYALQKLQAAGRDVRLTPRARLVLAILSGRETPLTAHHLYLELRDAGEYIGRTIVYGALHALTGAGLVHAFHAGAGEEATYRACSLEPHDQPPARVSGLSL